MVDFEKSFASSPKAEFWDYLKNEETPCEVFKSCNKKFWFICGECKHKFESSLNHITNGKWCPFCANRKLCEEDCSRCYEKSFASSPRAEFWDYLKNVKTPKQVSKSCNKKFWFICGECEHNFESSLGNITAGSWCPFCTKPSQKICEEDCLKCYENSFASHPKAEFWDYSKNEKNPCELSKGSHKKFWFICGECKHKFESGLGSVTKGRWCSYCANKKICNCSKCYEKSFASHPKADFWDSSKNRKAPNQVFKSSDKKFWFNCGDCKHKFDSSLNNVTAGTWCPMCVNKTEKMFLEWFKAKYDHEVTSQVKYDWCKNIRHLPFDFVVESLKLIIEIDGPQHFIQIANWKSPELTQIRDKYKEEKALENGYTIIRILQEDIFKNIKGWGDELVEFLVNI